MTSIQKTTPSKTKLQAADVLRIAIGRGARRLRQGAGGELTPSQAAVLDTIARQRSITPSKLAEVERLSRPTITRLVEKLKAQGLVECTPDPADGRSYRIAIAPAGAALRSRRRQRKDVFLTRLLDGATPDEIELLDRSSRVLLRLLEEDDEQ